MKDVIGDKIKKIIEYQNIATQNGYKSEFANLRKNFQVRDENVVENHAEENSTMGFRR